MLYLTDLDPGLVIEKGSYLLSRCDFRQCLLTLDNIRGVYNGLLKDVQILTKVVISG